MRLIHIAWAVLCGGVSVFLALLGGGHPPPIVLVPFVLAVWVIGHGLMWSVSALVRRGRRGLPDSAGWPPGLLVALLGLATMTALTLVQVVVTVQIGALYPYRGALWFVMAAAGVVHGVAFVGVLLRRAWARGLTSVICYGWSALVLFQVVDHFRHGRSISMSEGMLAIVLLAGPTLLGLHLMVSSRVRALFAPHQPPD